MAQQARLSPRLSFLTAISLYKHLLSVPPSTSASSDQLHKTARLDTVGQPCSGHSVWTISFDCAMQDLKRSIYLVIVSVSVWSPGPISAFAVLANATSVGDISLAGACKWEAPILLYATFLVFSISIHLMVSCVISGRA